MFKKIIYKTKSFFKTRWLFFIGFIFMWVIPIILLNETVSLTKEVSVGIKVTWMAFVVIFVAILILRKNIYGLIVRIRHGLIRGILKMIHKGILYGLMLGIIWGLKYFSNRLFEWCICSGISMLIGAIFYIIDESKVANKIKEDRKEEIRKILEEDNNR